MLKMVISIIKILFILFLKYLLLNHKIVKKQKNKNCHMLFIFYVYKEIKQLVLPYIYIMFFAFKI